MVPIYPAAAAGQRTEYAVITRAGSHGFRQRQEVTSHDFHRQTWTCPVLTVFSAQARSLHSLHHCTGPE